MNDKVKVNSLYKDKKYRTKTLESQEANEKQRTLSTVEMNRGS